MTLEEAANAVRLYVEDKPHDTGGEWLERLDEALSEIRVELHLAAQDDDRWSSYLDMTDKMEGRK